MEPKIDIWIICSEQDLSPTVVPEQSWIGKFKHFLESMLTQVIGSNPTVSIQSDAEATFSPEVKNQNILIAILSPAFIQSKKCLEWINPQSYSKDNISENQIFKVVKSPIERHEQPIYLRNSIEYDLYQLDDENGSAKEYTDFFSPEAEKQYWMKLVDLANDIHQSLSTLNGTDPNPTTIRNKPKKTVFLAETTNKLSIQKNIIKRELLSNGYTVLPNHLLSLDASQAEQEIRSTLAESQISIHMIGNSYGSALEGSNKSIVDLQNKLAAEYALTKKSDVDFFRLIWLAPNVKSIDERQKSFIETLKRDAEAQESAEVLQNSLEDFKNVVRDELIHLTTPTPKIATNNKFFYIIYDQIDAHEIAPIKEAIQNAGFTVLLPRFDGDLLEIRKQHLDNLKKLDAVLVYKGKANNQWVFMKMLDILKAPGLGRTKPIQAKVLTGYGDLLVDLKNNPFTTIPSTHNHGLEKLNVFLNQCAVSLK